MAGKFCISLTRSLDDPDRATVAFVIANAAVASGQETMVFLSVEGVRLAVAGTADAIHEEGFQPLKDLMASFVEAGGTILVCSPCFKKRELDSVQPHGRSDDRRRGAAGRVPGPGSTLRQLLTRAGRQAAIGEAFHDE